MTDDIMTRVREWLASCVRVATENGVPEEADLEAAALAFIDGEPARLAAKAEEERDALRAERDEVTMLLSGALYWTVASELMAANHTRAAHAVVDELAALRAQVEAARRWASESRPCACGHFVLRAMDEAKP